MPPRLKPPWSVYSTLVNAEMSGYPERTKKDGKSVIGWWGV